MVQNDLAWKIRHLRTAQNLTLQQVAQQVGVGKSTVRKWETGMIENMRRDKIASLAAALHTTPGYLMGWEDNTFRVNLTPAQQEKMLDILDKARNNMNETESFVVQQCNVSPQFFIKLQKPQTCLVSREELQKVAEHLGVEDQINQVINAGLSVCVEENNNTTTLDKHRILDKADVSFYQEYRSLHKDEKKAVQYIVHTLSKHSDKESPAHSSGAYILDLTHTDHNSDRVASPIQLPTISPKEPENK